MAKRINMFPSLMSIKKEDVDKDDSLYINYKISFAKIDSNYYEVNGKSIVERFAFMPTPAPKEVRMTISKVMEELKMDSDGDFCMLLYFIVVRDRLYPNGI